MRSLGIALIVLAMVPVPLAFITSLLGLMLLTGIFMQMSWLSPVLLLAG